MISAKALLNAVHGGWVFERRVRVLAQALSRIVPQRARVLDVGTGDGSLAKLIMDMRPGIAIEGVDVFLRPKTHIPVQTFDGEYLPFADESFDCVLFVDVLHHTENPPTLLHEAARVSKGCVIIKDHLLEGSFAYSTLRLMDWVGNRGHGVVLPYNYLTRSKWNEIIREAGLEQETWIDDIGLYPAPASWLFDRKLHFIARLVRGQSQFS